MIRRREARHRERAGQAHHGDKPYMDTFEREDVLESVRYYRPISPRQGGGHVLREEGPRELQVMMTRREFSVAIGLLLAGGWHAAARPAETPPTGKLPSPTELWSRLMAGNQRFVSGKPRA